ncbi:MAG: hypothetical protein QXV54_05535 [Desulfurococcaceae archaeon]
MSTYKDASRGNLVTKNTIYVASLTALSIVLKLRFFEIPYPPAPFLKYDISGVPLAVIAFLSFRYVPFSLIAYFLVHLALGADPIGMAMKCLAELSTFTPLVFIYRKLSHSRSLKASALITAVVSRVLVMTIANYLVTPYWLLWARWAQTFEDAYAKTIVILPHVAVFNATLAVVVSLLSMIVFNVLEKTGLLHEEQ